MFSKVVFFCFVLQLARGSISRQFRSEGDDVNCYGINPTLDKPQHAQFTTKTGYGLVQGSLINTETKITDCDPVKIWLLVRHGTTYPLKSSINDDELNRIKGSIETSNESLLCDESIDLLQSWEWNVDINDSSSNVLSLEGRNQMEKLATEYKEAFVDLFYSTGNVTFRYNRSEPRNVESFKGFATGLFGAEGERDAAVVEDHEYDDLLFKFYEQCGRWNEKNKKLKESYPILSEFENSDLFKNAIKDILVSLEQTEPFSWERVKNIWDMCRIDKSLKVNELSPWCSAFTRAHVDTLEYHEDIDLYYRTGRGDVLNPRLACYTVDDVIKHLEKESSALPKALVSFADATTIQLFLTALGIPEETPVPVANMAGMGERKWKSSEISPFASNIAVVKYECTSPELAQVKFFLNQKPLTLDWCTDNVCRYDKFIDHYGAYMNANCTEYFCSAEPSGNAKLTYGVKMLAVSLSLILVYLY